MADDFSLGAVRLGTVDEIDYDRELCKVKLKHIVTDFIPWDATRRKHLKVWLPPDKGDKALILIPDNNLKNASVLLCFKVSEDGSITNDKNIILFQFDDGNFIKYDIVKEKITINAKNSIDINGDLNVSGSIKASKDLEDSKGTLEAFRSKYKIHTHAGIGLPPTPKKIKHDE